jgi:hypothetical protein
MNSHQVFKFFLWIGFIAIGIGILVRFYPSIFRWLGHLPGDIRMERENFSFYFPITTLIILSLLVSAVARMYNWFTN